MLRYQLWHKANRLLFLLRHVLLNPRRIGNLLVYALARLRGQWLRENLGFVPFKLDVEPTTYCNFRCATCHVTAPDWKSRHMSLEEFKFLIDRHPEVFKIKLQGMGEPFINKLFLEMARYAASKGVYITTTTNGSALTKPIVQRLLAEHGLREIIVSLDGATKATFESVRPGSVFESVCENSARLISANAQLPLRRRVFVSAWTVLQKRNLDEARGIIDLAFRLGFHKLTFQVTISDWGKQAWVENKSQQVAPSDKEAQELADYAKQKGIWFQLYRDNRLEPGTPCPWPFDSMYVSADMKVVPCCSVADPSVACLASLGEQTIREVWNSKEYHDLRRAHLVGTPPGYCSQCYKR